MGNEKVLAVSGQFVGDSRSTSFWQSNIHTERMRQETLKKIHEGRQLPACGCLEASCSVAPAPKKSRW